MEEQQKTNIELITEAAKEYYGEDLVEYNPSTNSLVIKFPKVKVSNERDKFTIIYDLFARVCLCSDGLFNTMEGLSMIRSTYTQVQWRSGYVHSHLPRISHTPVWNPPCMGTGPIRGTLDILSHTFDLDRWGLFFYELDKFVKTESLTGGPYIRLESIGTSRNSLAYPPIRMYDPTGWEIPRETFMEILREIADSKEMRWKFTGVSWEIGMSPLEAALKMSRIIIAAVMERRLHIGSIKKLAEDGVMIPVLLKDNYLETVSSVRVNPPENHIVLFFKGQPQYLKVIESPDDRRLSYFYVLANTIVFRLINYLTDLMNLRYGTKKFIETQGKLYFL